MSPKIFKDFLFLSGKKKKKKVVKHEKSNYVPLALTLRRDANCALPGLGNCKFLALPCACPAHHNLSSPVLSLSDGPTEACENSCHDRYSN